MRIFFALLLGSLLALASCTLLKPTTAEQKIANFIQRHPEVAYRDTIRDTVRVEIPRIEIRKIFVADTAQQRRDRVLLDSLLNNVETALDSVQRAAARQRIQQWAAKRPVLNDTLCIDTLGVMGRIWRDGNTYQVWLERKGFTASAPVQTVVDQLKPCPPAPHFPWYDPRGFVWWQSMLLGMGLTWLVLYGVSRITRPVR